MSRGFYRKCGPMSRDFQWKVYPCVGIYCKKPTQKSGTSTYVLICEYPPSTISSVSLGLSFWLKMKHLALSPLKLGVSLALMLASDKKNAFLLYLASVYKVTVWWGEGINRPRCTSPIFLVRSIRWARVFGWKIGFYASIQRKIFSTAI